MRLAVVIRTGVIALIFALALYSVAHAQSALLQGGPWTPGHMPQYVGQGSSQPVVIDGGGASGGTIGATLGEIGVTSRDPNNNYPSANSGKGPFGSHGCLYDAPIDNASGYHFLCFDPNALGGGLLSYGAGGVAPQLPMQIDINGVLSVLGGSPPAPPIVAPVVANPPNTHQGYFAVTWTGTGPITLSAFGGQGIPAFTAADVGKDVTCTGIGALENQAYAGVISGVSSGSAVTLVPSPTITMSDVTQKCAYGSDQTVNLQTAFNNGQSTGVGSYVPGGIYLINTPLICLPPTNYNALTGQPPLCRLDPGAYLFYAGTSTATNVITYGSLDPSFSGYLNGGEIFGGTIDGNFNALNDVYVPFFRYINRHGQMTKNYLRHGVQYGDMAAPGPSAGANDNNNFGARDVNYVPVTGVTNGTPPVVTTAYPHGFTTGRVVTFASVVGQAGLSTKYFQITVTGANTFTLNNGSLSGSFTSANVAETMPSMAVEQPISAVTNASAAVITAPVGTVTLAESGGSFFIADLGMVNAAGTGNCIDGSFVATYISPTTFSIPLNSSACGSYTGGGWVIPAPDFDTVEAFIYNANSSDSQYAGDEFYGNRIGVSNSATNSGYDGKIQFHVYNYPENGELLAAFYGGGDNNFIGVQTDCPARFSLWLTHINNTSLGSNMNCGGFPILQNAEASFARLESGASLNQIGGSLKGQSGAAILQQVSSADAPVGQYGRIPNYASDKVWTFDVSFPQPDGNLTGNLQIFSAIASTTIEAVSTAASHIGLIEAYDTNAGDYGLSMTSGSGGGSLNLIDNTGAFSLTALYATPSALVFQEPVQFGSIPTSAGSGGLYVCVDSAGVAYKKSSCP